MNVNDILRHNLSFHKHRKIRQFTIVLQINKNCTKSSNGNQKPNEIKFHRSETICIALQLKLALSNLFAIDVMALPSFSNILTDFCLNFELVDI